MGGHGSGWQGSKRTRVEDCPVLSLTTLVRKGALVAGAWTSDSWCWTYEGEAAPHTTIGYEASLIDPADAWLRLHYRANGEPVDYRVRLVTTRPTYGGLRGRVVCPLGRRGGGPPPRGAQLLPPPGGGRLGE